MARSTLDTFVDAIHRRPEWVEQDDDHEVLVRGFSIADSAWSFVVGLIVLAASVAVLGALS